MPEAAPRALFPIFLDLNGKLCTVVGGGEVAARKVAALLAAGAQVRVVAPELCAELEELLAQPAVSCVGRSYTPGDLAGSALVIAATDDAAVNASVYQEAVSLGMLVNVADDPARCGFIVPSTVARGPIAIAISTGGASPALARHLRGRIEAAVPPAYGELARLLGRLRSEVKQAISPPGARARRWEAVLASDVIRLLEAGRSEQAEARARAILGIGDESAEGTGG